MNFGFPLYLIGMLMSINSTKISLFLAILLLAGCIEPEYSPPTVQFQKYLDGNIRSFDILKANDSCVEVSNCDDATNDCVIMTCNDTLFVASEEQGVVIYEIIDDSGIVLDSIFTSNEVDVPVTLDISENSRSLIVLDDYNHTYIGKADFFYTSSTLGSITCDDYQRRSAFIDYLDRPIELITPFRHKPTQNEVDELAWNTSFLHRITFDELTYDYNVYSADCSDTLYKYLNYKIEDVYYDNEKLYLVAPDAESHSVVILDHDLTNDEFLPTDTLYFNSSPTSISSIGDQILVCTDGTGCYIKLLDQNGQNNSNFNIASSYTIQDIQVFDNYIALSAGYGGVLIYKMNDSGIISDDDLIFMLGGVYAYRTFIYNDNIIVGTKNGLQIYKMEG